MQSMPQETAVAGDVKLDLSVSSEKNGSTIPQQVRASSVNFMPTIIPTFNNPTFLRGMIEQLEELHCANIIVVDNASTFPPMVAYLKQIDTRIKVMRMPDNAGPRRVWKDTAFYKSLPQVFCVTDPDLRFNSAMPPTFMDDLYAASCRHRIGKVGLALDISSPSNLVQQKFSYHGVLMNIWEWEARFWQREVETNVYSAPIDTTFALYNKSHFNPARGLRPALRMAGHFTCEHLPWLNSFSLPDAEVEFYRENNRHSSYYPKSDK